MISDQICISCINCIKIDNLYHCDFDKWTDKKFNDILILIPDVFECEEYEEYTGDVKYIGD